MDLIPPHPPADGTSIEKSEDKLEPTVRSLTGDSTKDSNGASSQGEPSSKIPTLKAWEGSRLKMVGLDALPTCKRLVAWFPVPVENTEHYFQQLHRLNRGLDNSHWRVYERRGEPNGFYFVLSIDSSSVVVMEKMGWRPFSGMGQVIFSLLGAKPEGKMQKGS